MGKQFFCAVKNKFLEMMFFISICFISVAITVNLKIFESFQAAAFFAVICFIKRVDFKEFKEDIINNLSLVLTVLLFMTYLLFRTGFLFADYKVVSAMFFCLFIGYTAKKTIGGEPLAHALFLFPLLSGGLLLFYSIKGFLPNDFFYGCLRFGYSNPNTLGRHLMLVVSTILILDMKLNKISRVIAYLFLAVCLYFLLLTGCRTALISVAALVFYKSIINFKFFKCKNWIVIYSLGLMTALIACDFSLPQKLKAINYEKIKHFSGRHIIWNLTIRAIKENKPLIGINKTDFNEFLLKDLTINEGYFLSKYARSVKDETEDMVRQSISQKYRFDSHSAYLNIITEYGYIGFGIVALLSINLFIACRKDKNIFGIYLVLLIHFLAESWLKAGNLLILFSFFPMGLLLAGARNEAQVSLSEPTASELPDKPKK